LKDKEQYDAVIVAVAHREFLNLNMNEIRKSNAIVFDLKACLDRDLVDIRL